MSLKNLFKEKYDSEIKKCDFCGYQAHPIIKTNKMGMGRLSPGPFFGHIGSATSKRHNKYILICPKCKCIIGSK